MEFILCFDFFFFFAYTNISRLMIDVNRADQFNETFRSMYIYIYIVNTSRFSILTIRQSISANVQ